MKLRRRHRSIDIITLIFCKKAAFFFSCLYSCHFLSIKSILIHEYQHESTRINAGQHESDTSQHESAQINTSPTRVQHESTQVRHESTRVNTSQHESTRINTTPTRVNTKQHESKTGLDHEKETNMVKRKDKT